MLARGFTLLELLVTLTILTLLLTVGLPSLSQQIKNNQADATTAKFYTAIQLTRNAAVTANMRVTMSHKGSWNSGWEIFEDANHNASREAGERLIAANEALPQIRITGNLRVKNYVSFIGTGEARMANGDGGGAFQAGTFTICPEQAGGRRLRLSRGGRLRMETITATLCDTK